MSLFQELTRSPFLLAGPCVIEADEILAAVAEELVAIREELQIPVVFKASFDKANRTSVDSFRGPGLEAGLEKLQWVKEQWNLPVLTDIHEAHQVQPVAEVVDIIQIPAFLCRQTDLLLAAGESGRIVNVKKGQFLSGQDMEWVVKKLEHTQNQQILLTERGNMFGYNNLVVDYRNIPDMQQWGYPVVMDATHAVQRPGGAGGASAGNREFVPLVAKAAAAAGVDGFFFEVHPNPDAGLSDAPNMLTLEYLRPLMKQLLGIIQLN